MDTIQPKIGLEFFFFYARTRRIDPQNNKENEKIKDQCGLATRVHPRGDEEQCRIRHYEDY